MTKLFWILALPLIALVTIAIGVASAQVQMDNLHEYMRMETKEKQRKSGYVEGKLLLVSEIKRDPEYREVLR